MNLVLVRNWWALALRGVFALLFGLIAFLMPGVTLAALVLMFGAYSLVDGVFSIIAGIRAAERRERWWPFALEGLLDILVGLIAFFMPAAAAFALLFVIAAWAIITGVLRISAAIRLRKEIRGEWMLILSGALSVILGIFLVFLPGAGFVTLMWWLGAYATIYGITMITLAFRLRAHRNRLGSARPVGGR